MHCEKNLCENITKMLLGGKDSIGSREDMGALYIRLELWLTPTQSNKDDFYIFATPYILNANEITIVMEIIKNLKTITNYVGTIHKCLKEGKLWYIKTHDFMC